MGDRVTPHDPRAPLRKRLGFIAEAIDNRTFVTPEGTADAILDTVFSTFEPHREELVALLAAEGLHVVPEGHAVIDGQVVALCTRCDHDTWLHSFQWFDGPCIPECGCRQFVSPVAGADEKETDR